MKHSMKRRDFLAGASVALAGCMATSPRRDDADAVRTVRQEDPAV